ncbi:MAG: hypothetical protein EA390_08860 [Balneolaceae bacterium]|nr:MAG: hypothetical protein EA390_08860 [Balneolaceae bacterium]
MLKQWIHQIRHHPEHYGTAFWKYQLSGQVLDLFIEAPYHLDKVSYRRGVVKIGMVLQALSAKFQENKCCYLIQSFPSLEDSRHVASIRVVKSKDQQKDRNIESCKADSTAISKIHKMVEYASENELKMLKVEASDLPDNLINHSESRSWYALCSEYNNPFTWLKVGYWQEMAHQLFRLSGSEDNRLFMTDFPDSIEQEILKGVGKLHIVHILIAIPR